MSKKEFSKIVFYIATSLIVLFCGLTSPIARGENSLWTLYGLINPVYAYPLLLQLFYFIILNFYLKRYTLVSKPQQEFIIFWLYLLFIIIWFSMIVLRGFDRTDNNNPMLLCLLFIATLFSFFYNLLTSNEKIKNLIVIALSTAFLFISIYYTMCSFGIILNKKERYFYSQLTKMSRSNKNTFELNELTNFKWDRVFVSKPYRNLDKNDLILLSFYNGIIFDDKKIFTIKFSQKMCQEIFNCKICEFSYNESMFYNKSSTISLKKDFQDSDSLVIDFFNN